MTASFEFQQTFFYLLVTSLRDSLDQAPFSSSHLSFLWPLTHTSVLFFFCFFFAMCELGGEESHNLKLVLGHGRQTRPYMRESSWEDDDAATLRRNRDPLLQESNLSALAH